MNQNSRPCLILSTSCRYEIPSPRRRHGNVRARPPPEPVTDPGAGAQGPVAGDRPCPRPRSISRSRSRRCTARETLPTDWAALHSLKRCIAIAIANVCHAHGHAPTPNHARTPPISRQPLDSSPFSDSPPGFPFSSQCSPHRESTTSPWTQAGAIHGCGVRVVFAHVMSCVASLGCRRLKCRRMPLWGGSFWGVVAGGHHHSWMGFMAGVSYWWWS